MDFLQKSCEDMTVRHQSLPDIEDLFHEITKLRLGQEEMAKEVRKMRQELEKEKAAKTAIIASWKYSMMRLKLET